jgi:hypothetical protein
MAVPGILLIMPMPMKAVENVIAVMNQRRVLLMRAGSSFRMGRRAGGGAAGGAAV